MVLFSVHGSDWMNKAIADVLCRLHLMGTKSVVAAWDERAYKSFRDMGHCNVIDMINLYRKHNSPSPAVREVREILRFDWEGRDPPEGVTPKYESHMITRCQQAYGSVDYLLRLINPSVLVIWNNLSFGGKLFDLLADKSVSRLYMERGPLPNTIQMSRRGINAELNIGERVSSDCSKNAKEVASRWIEDYRSKKFFGWPEHASSTAKIPQEVLDCKKPIALWASQVAYDTQITHHSDFGHEYHKVYDILRESWNKNGPLQLVIKLHPCHQFPWAHEKAKQIDGAIVTMNSDIRDWFELPNLCRIATVNSSVGFEALTYGIPTVTLGRNWYTGMTSINRDGLKDFLNTEPTPTPTPKDPWPPAVYRLGGGIDIGEFIQADDISTIASRVSLLGGKEGVDVKSICDAIEGR